jgi:hypothetical protein
MNVKNGRVNKREKIGLRLAKCNKLIRLRIRMYSEKET